MSHMATLPVIDMKFAHKASFKQDIYKNGLLYTGTVSGLCFEKEYEVNEGNVVKITSKEKETPVISLVKDKVDLKPLPLFRSSLLRYFSFRR